MRYLPLLIAAFWALEAPAQDATPASGEAEVQVHGRRSTRDEHEPENATSIVSDERLHQPGLELSEALRGEPSVQINQVGGAADLSTISIRGASAAQVPVYLAGVRINDDVVGVADLSTVPAFMVGRVRVYQGAPPLHRPRSGFAGALVIEPRLPQQNEAFLRAETGSFAAGAVAGGIAAAVGDTVTSVSLRRSGAQNDFRYRDDNGTAFDQGDDAWVRRSNADFGQTDVWWLTRYVRGTTRLHIIGQGLFREQGVTGLSLIPAEQARARITRGLAGISASNACSKGAWTCRLDLGTSALTTELETRDGAGELFVQPTTVVQHNQRVGSDAHAIVQSPSGLVLESSAAAEASRLISHASTRGALERTAGELFASGEWSVGSPLWDIVFVRGAGRYQCQRAQGTDVGYLEGDRPHALKTQQCIPGGRLGLAVQPLANLQLRAMALYGGRFPTLGERFGMSASMRGNPGLEAERGYGFDVGARLTQPFPRGEIELESSGYFRNTYDVIAYQRVALGYARAFNLEQGRFLGADVRARVDALSLVRLNGSFSFLDARSVGRGDANSLIPFRSALSGQGELELYKRYARRMISLWSVTTVLSYRGARYADPAELIKIPAQLTLDVAASAKLWAHFDVKFRVENVTDQQRFDTLGYPLPGRGYYLSLEGRY